MAHQHAESQHGQGEHGGHEGHHAHMIADFRRRFWVALALTLLSPGSGLVFCPDFFAHEDWG